MKKIAIILTITAIFGASVLYYFLSHTDSNIIKLFGNVEIRQVDLSFEVEGKIKEVYVEEGDYVKKGQLLAKLDDKDFISNYKKAYFEMQNAKSKMEDDASKFTRNSPLCKDNAVSKQECDTLLNNKKSSIAKYNELKANRDFQKNQLEHTYLYAPNDGIISTRAEEKGARVSKGEVVYVMNLLKPLWIRCFISENDFGNIKYGSVASILTDTINPKTNKSRVYKGYVGYISPVAEFTPKTVQSEELRSDLVYRLRVYVENPDEFIKQGMPVTVIFDLGKEEENGKLCNNKEFKKNF